MSNVRDLLRRFVQDDTVKEKKAWDGKVEQRPTQQATPVQQPRRREEVQQRPHLSTRRDPPAGSTPLAKLDPECEHEWQWKSGVKSCWLCGGAAPLDRRDSSTRWKG